MGELNLARVLWTLNRAYLRHGVSLVVAALGVAMALALSVSVAGSVLRLATLEATLADRVAELRGRPPVTAARDEAPSLPLPLVSRRFDITRRILAALGKTGFEPEQIRFKFESAGEAGLMRQIAVFTVKARWDDVARLLAQLQGADRAIYISKLRVARENAEDELVSAEVQLAVALLDDATAKGVAP